MRVATKWHVVGNRSVLTIDKNDVHQLKNTFLSGESFRYDEKNYISALVHTDQLDEALENAELDEETLRIAESEDFCLTHLTMGTQSACCR